MLLKVIYYNIAQIFLMYLKNRTILIVALASVAASVYSQIDMTIGYRRATAEVTSEIPVFVEEPSGTGFSTTGLSGRYPAYRIPAEEIRVLFPDLSQAVDTVGILWYLRPENYSQRGEVNIIIVAIGQDSSKTYYIDNNNDRVFADNEEKFSFSPDVEKRVLEIKVLGNYYNYTFMNPDYNPVRKTGKSLKEYSVLWRNYNRRPSFSFLFSMTTGGGKAQLSLQPVEGSIRQYSYNANIVGCLKPSAGIDFAWFNFHVAGLASFERLQYDETVMYAYGENFRGRYYDRGTWPSAKVHAGVSASYDFRIWSLYVSPVATYSKHWILDKNKFDRSVPVGPDAVYKDSYTWETGARLKLPVSERTVLFINYVYSKSWFDATDFLPEYVEGSYSVDYKQNYFGFGVLYRFLTF